ncbi:MAG TPA: ABC transporter permease [Dongiaceae bacterium]|nr:ABC transporter permease [Dongiaceae bacterium]
MKTSSRNPNSGRLTAVALLVLPLAVYALLYLMPIGSMIWLSLDNGELGRSLERFGESDARDPDARAAALLADMQAMNGRQQGEAARALNQEIAGFRTLFISTARKAGEIPPTMAGLTAFDARWADQRFWDVLRDNAGSVTWRHFRKATGLDFDKDGRLGPYGDDIYMQVMLRTLVIAGQVTIVTLVIGYPLAYAAANASPKFAHFVLIAVLVSFWTSVLVRTTAWVILLQTSGLVNTALVALSIVDAPIQLIFNRFGAIVSMTHVLLPFAIIPMMNVMRTIPKSQADASRILGAGPIETFLRVYLPQTLRGVAVGGFTVFILALGFYITPALTGGPGDQMLSFYIADFVKKSLNWGMASALSVLLLAAVLLLVGTFGLLNWATLRRKEPA